MEFTKLTHLQKDVLREIGNVGAGHAATSMSQLINRQVNMKVPSVRIVSINELIDLIGGPEKVIVAVLFQIFGDVPGTVYLIFSEKETERLIQQVMLNDHIKLFHEGKLNQLAVSTIQEVGNILTGSYLSALSDLTKLQMKTSVPYISIDMAAATLVTGLIEISQVSDYAMIIDTVISDGDSHFTHAHFLFVPEPASISKLFTSLGIHDYE